MAAQFSCKIYAGKGDVTQLEMSRTFQSTKYTFSPFLRAAQSNGGAAYVVFDGKSTTSIGLVLDLQGGQDGTLRKARIGYSSQCSSSSFSEAMSTLFISNHYVTVLLMTNFDDELLSLAELVGNDFMIGTDCGVLEATSTVEPGVEWQCLCEDGKSGHEGLACATCPADISVGTKA